MFDKPYGVQEICGLRGPAVTSIVEAPDRLTDLIMDAGYALEIQDAGLLEEEVYLAGSAGQTETEMREYARTVLAGLLDTRPPES